MNSWQIENFDPTAHRVDTHQFNAANSSLVSSTGDNADAELNALLVGDSDVLEDRVEDAILSALAVPSHLRHARVGHLREPRAAVRAAMPSRHRGECSRRSKN